MIELVKKPKNAFLFALNLFFLQSPFNIHNRLNFDFKQQ